MRLVLIILLLSIFYDAARAQQAEVFPVQSFIQQVKQFHPVVKQANLVTDKAEADLLAARGAFDPVAEFNAASKSLDGLTYYRYENPELKLPTRTPLTLKGGYEDSRGQYINPELTNGVASYLGVELPLLNGLLTDKKRTALQQARLYVRMSEQERQVMINDLLLDAYATYWEWAGAYQLYKVYSEFLDFAQQRLRLVNISFQNGDRSRADTIEAYGQLQNFKLMQAAALLDLNKRTLDLSTFLWSKDGNPYLLPEGYVPDTLELSRPVLLADTGQLVQSLPDRHPTLLAGRIKGNVLIAERKLKFQNLLPVVNLQANLLSKNYFDYKDVSTAYFENNYKLGLNVRVPLLFRQGRGEYRAAQLKIRENNLDLSIKTVDITNKVKKYYAEATQLERQLQIAREMMLAYRALLKAEELKFSQGESSLFLINTRENKVLELQQKIVELQIKYLNAAYALQWAGGIIQ